MHIGIVAPCSSGLLLDFLPEDGGVDLGCGGYLIATLVRALIQKGHRLSVITLSPELKEPRTLKGPQLTYYVYPMRTRKRMRDLYKVEREGLREGIRKAKPDVLHAHWTYEFALACLETALPTVVTIHDNAFRVLRFQTDLYRVGRLYLQIRVLRNARVITAVSPYIAHSLQWLAKAEIKVIPNTVEVQHSLHDFGDGGLTPVRIATVLNGWQRLKNPKAAIEAFQFFRRDRPDATMYMYGEDFEEGGVAFQWASTKGLDQNIHFCGFVSNHILQVRLRKMSILLHPSLEESFGMAIAEAMSLGLPVVGGINVGSVPWILDHGRAGFLTDVTDPKQIARTLRTCLEQGGERQKRQAAAYQRVVTLFSLMGVATQYEAMYEKAIIQ